MAVEITAVHMSGGTQHEHIATYRWKSRESSETGDSSKATMVDWIDNQKGVDPRGQVQRGPGSHRGDRRWGVRLTAALNEDLVEAIDAIGKTVWSGEAFRCTNARREPLSGEGARRAGGRYNPRELFPAVYLAQPVQACMRELERGAETSTSGWSVC